MDILNFKSNAHKLNVGGKNTDHAREFVLTKKPDNKLAVELSAVNDEFSFEEVRNAVLSSTVVEYELEEKKRNQEIYTSIDPVLKLGNNDEHSRLRIFYDKDGISQIVVEPTYLVSCTYLKA